MNIYGIMLHGKRDTTARLTILFTCTYQWVKIVCILCCPELPTVLVCLPAQLPKLSYNYWSKLLQLIIIFYFNYFITITSILYHEIYFNIIINTFLLYFWHQLNFNSYILYFWVKYNCVGSHWPNLCFVMIFVSCVG